MNTNQFKEEILKEFDDRLFKDTIEHDSWLRLNTENRKCSCYIEDGEIVKWLSEKLDLYAEQRVAEERKRVLQDVLGVVDEYFEGLLVIPFPDLTKESIKASITKQLT